MAEVKSYVDTKTSAADILDPSKPEAIEKLPEVKKDDEMIGDSYPTPEALEKENEAREKMLEEKAKKEAAELAPEKAKPVDPSAPKTEVRSAIDPTHGSVVHPGAIEKK